MSSVEPIKSDHAITPQLGTVYQPNGLRADLNDPRDYPVEAVCVECGRPVRRDTWATNDRWYHFDREPADR